VGATNFSGLWALWPAWQSAEENMGYIGPSTIYMLTLKLWFCPYIT